MCIYSVDKWGMKLSQKSLLNFCLWPFTHWHIKKAFRVLFNSFFLRTRKTLSNLGRYIYPYFTLEDKKKLFVKCKARWAFLFSFFCQGAWIHPHPFSIWYPLIRFFYMVQHIVLSAFLDISMWLCLSSWIKHTENSSIHYFRRHYGCII